MVRAPEQNSSSSRNHREQIEKPQDLKGLAVQCSGVSNIYLFVFTRNAKNLTDQTELLVDVVVRKETPEILPLKFRTAQGNSLRGRHSRQLDLCPSGKTSHTSSSSERSAPVDLPSYPSRRRSACERGTRKSLGFICYLFQTIQSTP